jgi:hypothetical protein
MLHHFETIVGLCIGTWMSVTIGFIAWTISSSEELVHTHIFALGPNQDLFILGICIDTFPKYGIVASFCFINSGMRVMNGNVLHSWMINEIQDTKNKLPVPIVKAYGLSFISVIYNWFDFFMYMNILMSQIDMLLIEIGADLIMTSFLTTHYLKIKRLDDYII